MSGGTLAGTAIATNSRRNKVFKEQEIRILECQDNNARNCWYSTIWYHMRLAPSSPSHKALDLRCIQWHRGWSPSL